jgi:adenine phosphoribosyltransferase
MVTDKLKKIIRDIPDFPSPGIIFKDITPILKDPKLCSEMIDVFVERLKDTEIHAVTGIESRGFLFGLMLANRLNVPFVPIRKVGKLPCKTVKQEYNLEYGAAAIEIHQDAFQSGSKVLIHDDLLATGGTVEAASKLIERLGGVVAGYSFIVGLDFLNGSVRLAPFSKNIVKLVSYQ